MYLEMRFPWPLTERFAVGNSKFNSNRTSQGFVKVTTVAGFFCDKVVEAVAGKAEAGVFVGCAFDLVEASFGFVEAAVEAETGISAPSVAHLRLYSCGSPLETENSTCCRIYRVYLFKKKDKVRKVRILD